MTPILRTTRLQLRAPRSADAQPIADFLKDFEVAGNLSQVPLNYSLANAQDWIAANRDGDIETGLNFVVSEPSGEAMGVVSLSQTDRGLVLGYWLGQPYWGRGLMTEAVSAGLSWLFSATDIEEIVSGVFHFNMASLAIQQKLGFVETGRSFVHCLARAQDLEHIDTELTREAFEASGWWVGHGDVQHMH